jgi:hypothetical protein
MPKHPGVASLLAFVDRLLLVLLVQFQRMIERNPSCLISLVCALWLRGPSFIINNFGSAAVGLR